MKCKKTCRRGFTLAELIMAIALLAVFSVFVVQMFAKADQLSKKARTLDQAVACAANLADQWKMAATDGIPAAILDLRQDRQSGRTASLYLDSHFQICGQSDRVYLVEMTLQEGAPEQDAAAKVAGQGLWQLNLVIGQASPTDSGPIYTLTVCDYFPEEVSGP